MCKYMPIYVCTHTVHTHTPYQQTHKLKPLQDQTLCFVPHNAARWSMATIGWQAKMLQAVLWLATATRKQQDRLQSLARGHLALTHPHLACLSQKVARGMHVVPQLGSECTGGHWQGSWCNHTRERIFLLTFLLFHYCRWFEAIWSDFALWLFVWESLVHLEGCTFPVSACSVGSGFPSPLSRHQLLAHHYVPNVGWSVHSRNPSWP